MNENSTSTPGRWPVLFALDEPQSLGLLLFTSRLAAMMESKINPACGCEVLAEEGFFRPLVLREVASELYEGQKNCRHISEAEKIDSPHTWWLPLSLFRVFGKHPEIFSPAYVSMVEVGERSGTVDELLRLLERHLVREHRLLFGHLNSRPILEPGILAQYAGLARLTTFFEGFAMLLSSGWALLPAMEIVSGFLSTADAAEFREIRNEISARPDTPPLPMDRLAFIPPFAKQMTSQGAKDGRFEQSLWDVAVLLSRELDYRFGCLPQ